MARPMDFQFQVATRSIVSRIVIKVQQAGRLAAILGIYSDIRICESRNACVTVSVRQVQTVVCSRASCLPALPLFRTGHGHGH